MNDFAVLTAIGQDRPGLVDAVSSFILRTGCNIEDSRMAILGGEFAMIILLAGERAAVEKAQAEADAVGRQVGLSVHVRRTQRGAEAAPRGTLPFELNAYSLDHPGIVQRVAHFLAERKINIRALDTRVTNAPHSGHPVFSLYAVIDVPAGENVAELRRQLGEIGAGENIDFEMKPAQG